MNTIVDTRWHGEISQACEALTAMATEQDCNVSYEFNGVNLLATPGMSAESLLKFWRDEMDKARAAYEASPQYAIDQQRIKDANARSAAEQARPIGVFTVRDQAAWDAAVTANGTDWSYGGAVILFCARWAEDMEAILADGVSTVAQAAERTQYTTAEPFGLTGFQYGCAVHCLAQCWKWGEALRKWHNAEYGVTDAAGTVNPAIMTIGGAS